MKKKRQHQHQHRLPATSEEWLDAYANSLGQKSCPRCPATLSPALSITMALEVAQDGPPSLEAVLRRVRREYGPWAVVAACFSCGDLSVWPITEQQRRDLVDRLSAWGQATFAPPQ